MLRRLGHGSLAEVFLVELHGVEPAPLRAALKRPLPHLAEESGVIEMFLDEARCTARLAHPAIANFLAAQPSEGEPVDHSEVWIAFEWVDGVPLRTLMGPDRQKAGPRFLPAEVRHVGASLASALSHAHEGGAGTEAIVHRDVSAENVMVARTGDIKLIDFGVARVKGRLRKTKPGAIVGKAGAMAPEQALGEEVTPAADAFALGSLLYSMLAGKPAFGGRTARDRMNAVVQAEPAPLLTGPEDLVELIGELHRRIPTERPSLADVAQRLHEDGSFVADAAPSLSRRVAAAAPVTGPSAFEEEGATQTTPIRAKP